MDTVGILISDEEYKAELEWTEIDLEIISDFGWVVSGKVVVLFVLELTCLDELTMVVDVVIVGMLVDKVSDSIEVVNWLKVLTLSEVETTELELLDV